MRVAAALLTVLMVTVACGGPQPPSSGSPPATSPGAPSQQLATPSGNPSTQPTPATDTPLPPLPDSADLPPLPAPAPLPEGAPQQQAEALNAQLALATTAEERVPLVMTMLLASGIPVIDEQGTPVAFEPAPSGMGVRAWEVHAIAAIDPARHVQMRAADMAELFIADASADEAAELAAALAEDIRTSAFVADPDGQRWAHLLAQRDRRGWLAMMSDESGAELVLDGLQVALVINRLAGDVWREELAQAGGAVVRAAAYRPPAGGLLVNPAAPADECRYTEREARIIKVAETVTKTAMSKVIGHIVDQGERGLLSGVSGLKSLKAASRMAGLAQFVLQYLLVKIDFELSDPPLVRTKSTSTDGERRQLAATLRFDTGNLHLLNCFRLMWASLGLSMSVPEAGPLANSGVSWEPDEGFDRVQFYGDPVHAFTDGNGTAVIGIEGRRQKVALAPTAGRVETTASVLLTYQVKQTSLGKDLVAALSAATDVVKAFLGALERAKWASAGYAFPVVDWGERWQVEIVIDEQAPTGSTYFSWTGVMGIDSEGLVVGTGEGDVTIIGKLCVDIPPDGHSEAVDWRIDGEHTFAFDGYKEGDVIHVLLPNLSQSFRQSGDPGPCAFDAAVKQAGAQTLLLILGDPPGIQLRAQQGTQQIPYGDVTLTIRMEPVGD